MHHSEYFPDHHGAAGDMNRADGGGRRGWRRSRGDRAARLEPSSDGGASLRGDRLWIDHRQRPETLSDADLLRDIERLEKAIASVDARGCRLYRARVFRAHAAHRLLVLQRELARRRSLLVRTVAPGPAVSGQGSRVNANPPTSSTHGGCGPEEIVVS